MPTTTTGIATEFITFSRPGATGGGATVTDSDGRIKWAPHNLLLASEQFDASNWSKNAATVAANAIAAPNGTTTADTITSTGSGSYVLQSYSAISGTVTVSVFAKPGTNSSVVLRAAQAGNGYETSFTLSGSGTAGTPTIVGTGGTVSGMTAAISSLANSWYLCSITFAETSLGNVFILQSATSGTIHLWGAALYRSDLGGMQANTSAYPMYNPTTPKNLLGFTESFLTAWSSAGISSTLVDGGVANPRGLNGSVRLLANASTGTHNLQQGTITASTGVMTYSLYVKYSNLQWLALGMYDSGWRTHAFDILNGVKGTAISAGLTGDIQSAGNGWYRISITRTASTSTVFFGIFLLPSDTTTTSWTTVGTEAAYLWGAQLSDSASLDPYVANHFTAPSAAAYYGPRRDFDGATLACKGLLVEELRTNLVLQSNAFNTTWQAARATVSADTEVSPDQTQNADTLVEDTTTNSHPLYQSVSSLTTQAYTLSVYLKAAGRTKINLQFSNTAFSTSPNVTVDLIALTATGANGGTGSTPVAVGNSWYRCTLTATAGAAGTGDIYIQPCNAAGSTSYLGAGTAAFHVYGAQLEAGSFATSYIPTGSASATRNADVASVSTQAFPYSATEGTIVANVSAGSASYGVFLYSDMSNYITTRHASSGVAAQAVSGGAVQASFGSAVLSGKTAVAYRINDYAVSVNGAAASVATPPNDVPPAATLVRIGAGGNGVVPVNGHIRQITYIPRRLTNAELVARST